MKYQRIELFLPHLIEAEEEILKAWSLNTQIQEISSRKGITLSSMEEDIAKRILADIFALIKEHDTLEYSSHSEALVCYFTDHALESHEIVRLYMALQHQVLVSILTRDASSFYESKEPLFELNELFEYKLATILNIFSEVQQESQIRQTQGSKDLNICEPYQIVVDQICAVVVTDPQGFITFVNDRFCELSGYSRDTLIGSSVSIVKHLDSPKSQFTDIWNTINNKKVWTGELRNCNESGSAYYVSTTIAPILDDNGDIKEMISVQYDITLLKEQERDLKQFYEQEENRRLSRLLESQGRDLVITIPLPSMIIDADNIIVEYNDALLELFNIEADSQRLTDLTSHSLKFTSLLDQASQERFNSFTEDWVTLYDTLYVENPLTAECEVNFEPKRFELKLSQFKGIKTLICLVQI